MPVMLPVLKSRTGEVAEPMFWKYLTRPLELLPTAASRSPSPSRSTKTGMLKPARSTVSNGLAAPDCRLNTGAMAVPVFL